MLWVRVNALGSETVLAKVMKVVSDAQLRKPQVQAFADRVSGYFVPCVITLALLVWIVWAYVIAYHLLPAELVDHDPSSMHPSGQMLAFMFGCAVLVIACPCAMGLATPTAVMVGSGVGASNGVLFRGGDVLERAAQVTAVVFDKTGTLTTGKLTVARIECWAKEARWRGPPHRQDARARAALAPRRPSSARSTRSARRSRPRAGPRPEARRAVQLWRRSGVACSASSMARRCCSATGSGSSTTATPWTPRRRSLVQLEAVGHTVVLVAISGQLAGMLAVSDTLKPEAVAAWQLEVGRRPGSSRRQRTDGAYLAGQVGIRNVLAEVKPTDKQEQVVLLQAQGKVVAIGDGVNDAPALAQADVGEAVGLAPTSVETADVVLTAVALTPVALHLSKVVMRRIRLNFVWAFGYNIVGDPLAAGVFTGFEPAAADVCGRGDGTLLLLRRLLLAAAALLPSAASAERHAPPRSLSRWRLSTLTAAALASIIDQTSDHGRLELSQRTCRVTAAHSFVTVAHCLRCVGWMRAFLFSRM